MDTLTLEKLPEAVSVINQKLDTLLNLQINKERDPDRLMTHHQLSEYLHEKPAKQTIYGWTNARKIPFEKHGKNLFFRKSEIDIWLANGRQIKL